MGILDVISQFASTKLQEKIQVNVRSTKGSTTILNIQRFGNIYAITSHHIDPSKHFGPVAPGGAISVDEDFLKKKVISEFEALAKGEIDYEDLGAIMYNYFIPESIRDHLEKIKPSNLVIMTVTEHDIPWEFMSDGKNFWCTNYNMGRVLIQDAIQEQENVRLAKERLRIAVIVSDREGDLPEAKKEGETIVGLLHDDPEIYVRLFSNGEVTKINVLKTLLRGKYDVIHYAGHADFSISEPRNSYLKLNDSKLSYDEIARLRFDKNARPVIFANACSTSKSAFVGDKLISLASAFVNAGALAYIGTMWPIQDMKAADFAAKFYSNLKRHPVGEALKIARSNIRNISNDVNGWVPYAYFGDPGRKIQLSNLEIKVEEPVKKTQKSKSKKERQKIDSKTSVKTIVK